VIKFLEGILVGMAIIIVILDCTDSKLAMGSKLAIGSVVFIVMLVMLVTLILHGGDMP